MMWLDIAGALLLCAGAFFCLSAAVGIVRFPDVMTRLHAATKPQVFGLLLVLAGVMLTLRTWQATALGLLVMMLQVVTAPVSAHMVARTAFRTGQWDIDDARVDELSRDLAEAGFVNSLEEPSSDDRTPASGPAVAPGEDPAGPH